MGAQTTPWKFDPDEWVRTPEGVWYGILSRGPIGGESSGKFLDIEGKTKEQAVLDGMNEILMSGEP